MRRSGPRDLGAGCPAGRRRRRRSVARGRRATIGDVIDVPEVVRNKARAAGAGAWLADLPELVDALAAEWAFVVGDVVRRRHGGVRRGRDAGRRHAGRAEAARAASRRRRRPRDHRAAPHRRRRVRRRCCATTPTRGALLLERLGPSMFDLGLPFDERLPILADTAARVWRPAPDSGPADRRGEGPLARRAHRAAVGRARPAVRGAGRRPRHGLRRAADRRPRRRAGGARPRRRAPVERPAQAGRRPAGSSSIPTACSPSPSTTSASSCARTPSS